MRVGTDAMPSFSAFSYTRHIKQISQGQMKDRNETRRQGISLGCYRTQLLLQALQRSIGTMTGTKCGQCFRLMQTYFPGCLNSEEIQGY